MQEKGNDYHFLILGIKKVKAVGQYFKAEWSEKLADIVGKTSQIEAMLLLKHIDLVISEDSGLFHISYVVGAPTLGIFCSTRNDWTNHNMPHRFCFNSSDLECGNCMRKKCLFKEIKCFERVKP